MAKQRILVAEDDPELQRLVEFFLTKLGYEPVCVSSGTAALKAVETQSFVLVLLDVMMGEVDGYHVANAIDQKGGPDRPKILIMTSRDLSREKGVAAMSGADATIQKPFKLGDLKKAILELLG